MLLKESFLQRVQLSGLFQAFDGFNLTSVSLNRQQRAGLDRLPVGETRPSAPVGIIRPEVQRALDKLKKVPVDIEPRFVTAEQLLREAH